jgi:hypothetical protein
MADELERKLKECMSLKQNRLDVSGLAIGPDGAVKVAAFLRQKR